MLCHNTASQTAQSGSLGGAVLPSEMQIKQLTDSDYKSNKEHLEVHWLKPENKQNLKLIRMSAAVDDAGKLCSQFLVL